MKLENLRTLVKEELSKRLNEEYQDKFKMVGMLITNIKKRPQKEIFSDIRSHSRYYSSICKRTYGI
jgi:hypothetical protein